MLHRIKAKSTQSQLLHDPPGPMHGILTHLRVAKIKISTKQIVIIPQLSINIFSPIPQFVDSLLPRAVIIVRPVEVLCSML